MHTTSPIEILQEAASAVDRLSRLLKKTKSTQVKSNEERQLIKATALAWFNNYRSVFVGANSEVRINLEHGYTNLFEYSAYATSRAKYKEELKKIRKLIILLQSNILSNPIKVTSQVAKPDFLPLVPDPKMRIILENRWEEIVKCLGCKASLSAVVMMGGLLEALFLARVNKVADKSLIFKAKSAPRDKTGKTLALNGWMLNSYIDVAAELNWITKPAKDIGVVLRDYRNFIHPERELSTGVTITFDDASMFWSIFVQLTQQILKVGVLKS